MVRCLFIVGICLFVACLCEEKLEYLLPPVEYKQGFHSKRSGVYEIPIAEWPDNGVPGDVNVYPSYDERSMGVWLNVARIGYRSFRDEYLSVVIKDGTLNNVFDESSTKMASVAPGFWNFNLNRAARGHCTDVCTHQDYWSSGGGHEDANGTSTSDRIHKFSSWSSEIYINKAPGKGLYKGFSSVASWLCDGFHSLGSSFLPSVTKCPHDTGLYDDGSQGKNGHRYGVMTRCLQIGCGVDTFQGHSSYTTTCDCWNTQTTKYSGLHIALASHTGDPKDTTKFMYVATILTTGITVGSVKVIEETAGSTNTITLTRKYSGSSGAVYMSQSYTLFEQCRTYYFELQYGSTTERYPATGYFYTYGMNCNTDWKVSKLSPDCTSGVCCDTQTKLFKSKKTVCRPKTGGCDIEENCTGASADCPADKVLPAKTICNKSSGVCESESVCDGTNKACPAKIILPNGTVCRNGTGPCDPPEVCNGVAVTCPNKAYHPQGYVCNASSGPCERDAVCNGRSAYCPSKTKLRSVVCRNSTGPCDPAEKCDGVNATCPPDVKYAEGYICNKSRGACEADGVCNGKNGICSARSIKKNGTVCSQAAGTCEYDSVCDGTSYTCPSKKRKAKNTLCRAAVGLCDIAEYCTGTSGSCPTDTFKKAGTVCNKTYKCTSEDSLHEEMICNETYHCTGKSRYCPFEEPESHISDSNLNIGMINAISGYALIFAFIIGILVMI